METAPARAEPLPLGALGGRAEVACIHQRAVPAVQAIKKYTFAGVFHENKSPVQPVDAVDALKHFSRRFKKRMTGDEKYPVDEPRKSRKRCFLTLFSPTTSLTSIIIDTLNLFASLTPAKRKNAYLS